MLPGDSRTVLALCAELGRRAPLFDGLGYSFYRW